MAMIVIFVLLIFFMKIPKRQKDMSDKQKYYLRSIRDHGSWWFRCADSHGSNDFSMLTCETTSNFEIWIRTSQKSSFWWEKSSKNCSKCVISVSKLEEIMISNKSVVGFSAKYSQELKKRVDQSTKISSKNHQHSRFVWISKFT